MKFSKLTSAAEVSALLQHHIYLRNTVVLDTETTGLNPHVDKLTDIVMTGYEPESAVIFSAALVGELNALAGSAVTLVLHNFRFDFNFLYRSGVDLRGLKMYDTMLLHHLYDENKPHGLDAIVQEFWQDPYKELFWGKYKDYGAAPEGEQIEYACKDVVYTRRLYDYLTQAIAAGEMPYELVGHVHALAQALYNTELSGVRLDLDYLMRIGGELKVDTEQLRVSMLDTAAGYIRAIEYDMWADEIDKRKTPRGKLNVPKPEFNFDSGKQLMKLLYGKLRLPTQFNQKTKAPSVDDAALETLKPLSPFVTLLQDYRGKQKVYTAFIEGTLEKMQDGRIYPSFNVNGTVTGRISSSNPNMQQLPREGGVRGMYVPDDGHVLITCDYSQLEICIAAHFSADPVLLDIVRSGKSMHDHTAAACGIERQQAKMVNFLTIYGGTEYRLSIALGISIQRAQGILKTLWKTYRGLKTAIDEAHAKVEAGVPIVNPFGRKRRFPTEFESDKDKARACRQAFNALVQGTGADLTHESFYTVSDRIAREGLGRALFEVHDEIVIQAHKDSVDAAKRLLQDTMVGVGKKYNLLVPLTVDCSDALERWEK